MKETPSSAIIKKSVEFSQEVCDILIITMDQPKS